MQFKTSLATDLIRSLLLNNEITLAREAPHTKYRHMVNMLRAVSLQAGQESSQNCLTYASPFAVFFLLCPLLTKTEDLLTHCLGQCGINGAKNHPLPSVVPLIRIQTRYKAWERNVRLHHPGQRDTSKIQT